SVTHPVHIREYKDLTVGVDAYCWLHRGTFSCSTELCTGVETERHIQYCMKRVDLLRDHGVTPIMVFDGASLPIKRGMHLERRRRREDYRAKAEAALAAGEAGLATQYFSKSVSVTHQMAHALIKALRRAGVKLLVAPYEADAQLAYLTHCGLVDAVLTEDSDCLTYGCKKVLFKMDNTGLGQEIQLRNLAANESLSLCNWKNSMFLDMCLLTGCDYLTSIKGMGVVTAHKHVSQYGTLDKIMKAINASNLQVPDGYWTQYKMARLTFRHQVVYDLNKQCSVHLMPLGRSAKEFNDLSFLGSELPPHIAQGVASGHLDPNTHEPYRDGSLSPKAKLSALGCPVVFVNSTPQQPLPRSGVSPPDSDCQSMGTDPHDDPHGDRKHKAIVTDPPPVANLMASQEGPTGQPPKKRACSEVQVPVSPLPSPSHAVIDHPFSTPGLGMSSTHPTGLPNGSGNGAPSQGLASFEGRMSEAAWGLASRDEIWRREQSELPEPWL
ncbi:unnamed protein product, partial [Discosporangium mesarthrocarpum]